MTPKGVIVPACGDAGAGAPARALQLVANRPIVCHALDELSNAGVKEVAVVVAAAASADVWACVTEDGPPDIDVRLLIHDTADAFDGAFEAAARFVDEAPCIVHIADGLLAEPLAPHIELLRDDTPDLLVLVHPAPGGADCIGLATRRLLHLAEARHARAALALAGVCAFGPGALPLANGTRWCLGSELDLVPVAEQLVAAGGRLHVGCTRGWRRYTGEARDLLEMNRFMLDALGPQPGRAPGEDNRIEGPVAVHPTASIRSSMIVGPAIVGAGARIIDSYVGPYTSIGANARIEGVEIERSIILAGASIMHVGGRLAGSVVGRDARIFRDFSLPRAMRVNVGDGGEVALC